MTQADRGFRVKRVYDAPDPSDGTRVLVDRLWPRGLTREKAAIDLWLKEVAPSDVLRRRVHGDPDGQDIFPAAYAAELAAEPAAGAAARLCAMAAAGVVTLLFAAKDEARNNATVLRDLLQRMA